MIGCHGCSARQETIKILQEQLKNAESLMRTLRSEWSRAVDARFADHQMVRIGQGISQNERLPDKEPDLSVQEFQNIFNDQGGGGGG